MNRNSKSHFSATDNRINIGRSRFERNSWWKGSLNTGDLVPFYVDEVLPGDTFEMDTSVLCRMSTPITPVMDNCYFDTYFFFTPSRLVWEHWKEFMGENNVNAWVSDVDYKIPQLQLSPNKMLNEFTLVDYFGLPTEFDVELGVNDYEPEMVSQLPFRAYQLIWNEWFRDQNLQDPILIERGDSDLIVDEEDPAGDIIKVLDLISLRKVNKFHDYFTSALPAPQKGNPVLIPGFDGSVPVVTGKNRSQAAIDASIPLRIGIIGGTGDGEYRALGSRIGAGSKYGEVSASTTVTSRNSEYVVPSNLYVGSSSGVTIDALRTAFQIQKLLWRDGNGGSRYTEIIRSHFGVVSPDARLQRPEYLGGKRIPITVNQVVQQSATDDTSPQGNVAATSKTVDSNIGFTKSFTEHGYIIGVCCLRTDHTYQQGINRMWSRSDRYDFYFPELAHIGEQAIKNREIYPQVTLDRDYRDDVFGYQEAWAEYRMRPSFVTGAFRSSYSGGSLDIWHYADDYSTLPRLSSEWIQETNANVERTLAVQNATERHEQWLVDFYFDLKTTRPMPVYSVPGLVDHF